MADSGFLFLNIIQVLNPIIALILNVLFQVLGFRYVIRSSLLKSLFLGFFFGFIVLISLEFYAFVGENSGKDCLYIAMVNVITYSALAYCYFHFVNLGETARRIRIVRELYKSKNGLSMKELLAIYNARKMVEMRISRLLNSGQIICKNNKYYVGKPVILFIAKVIIIMKIIILGKKSEFD